MQTYVYIHTLYINIYIMHLLVYNAQPVIDREKQKNVIIVYNVHHTISKAENLGI